METGMMWFDNDPKKNLELKIQQAADFYRKKYGCKPDICLVNPKTLVQSTEVLASDHKGKIKILLLRAVLPDHLWIGVE